jgi:hypothetical protein
VRGERREAKAIGRDAERNCGSLVLCRAVCSGRFPRGIGPVSLPTPPPSIRDREITRSSFCLFLKIHAICFFRGKICSIPTDWLIGPHKVLLGHVFKRILRPLYRKKSLLPLLTLGPMCVYSLDNKIIRLNFLNLQYRTHDLPVWFLLVVYSFSIFILIESLKIIVNKKIIK